MLERLIGLKRNRNEGNDRTQNQTRIDINLIKSSTIDAVAGGVNYPTTYLLTAKAVLSYILIPEFLSVFNPQLEPA